MEPVFVRDAQNLPDPIAPLTASLLLPAIEKTYREVMGRHIPLGDGPAMVVRDHHLYMVWYPPRGPPQRPPLEVVVSALRAAPSDWDQRIRPRLDAIYADIDTLFGAQMPPAEGGAHLDRLADAIEEVWHLHWEVVVALSGSFALHGILRAAGFDDAPQRLMRLMGMPLNELVAFDVRIRALGTRINARDDLAPLLASAPEKMVEALLADQTEVGRDFTRLWHDVRQRSTGKGLVAPTWQEDPTVLQAGLAAGTGPRRDIEEVRRSAEAQRVRTLQETRERLPAHLVAPFDALESALRVAGPLAGTHHLHMDERVAAIARLAVVRAGALLRASGRIDDAVEVIFLQRHELANAFAADREADLRPLIAERRKVFVSAAQTEPPRIVGEPPASFYEDPFFLLIMGVRPPAEPVTMRLEGIAASPGIHEGEVRIVDAEVDLADVGEGDVLVARATFPSWTTAMCRAGAMVTASGGMLCHAAIVARELGTPAVVAVPNVMERLRAGARVRVDGDAGTVEIIGSTTEIEG